MSHSNGVQRGSEQSRRVMTNTGDKQTKEESIFRAENGDGEHAGNG